jgi:hypothetical protein
LDHIQSQTQVKQQEVAQTPQSLAQLDRSINIQLDANRAQSALNARRQQQAERAQLQERITQIQADIQTLNNQKLALNEVQISQETKLGPIRYVMAIVNPDGDPTQAVKWLILVLVMVCDPLAVLMVMAASARKQEEQAVVIMPGTIRYWNSEWQAYTGTEWQVVQSTMPSATPAPYTSVQTGVPDPQDLKPLAQLVDQVVTEVIKQRPIFEMGGNHASEHVRPAYAQPELNPEHLQKLIEHTLENWMNRTLTVTYSADQTEIDRIVEKVIARTSAAPPHEQDHAQPAQPEQASTASPYTEPQPVVVTDTTSESKQQEPASPDTNTSADTDTSNTRPIYNYFGEERVRGGKKHNLNT